MTESGCVGWADLERPWTPGYEETTRLGDFPTAEASGLWGTRKIAGHSKVTQTAAGSFRPCLFC
ncbi:hypothetical protein FA13DRAFT_1740415 [Coprinellus micaceus]|uniref:Uncharacterized protein n=1 Tax=Coprinellus micaceus TaxID=71717 RepID=A0A4Y7SNB2_COPMI|nr:hypothetical protein FA13DRAFT_1740415 [Coprinellus micaceus]